MAAPRARSIDWNGPLPRVVHGTSVALGEKGILLIGPSGAGKSSLALQLMAFGATLISDDLTRVTADHTCVRIESPIPEGQVFGIEARGLGLLAAPKHGPARLDSIVDMGHIETDRLPPLRTVVIAGHSICCLHRVDSPAFPAMLLQYLRRGRQDVS